MNLSFEKMPLINRKKNGTRILKENNCPGFLTSQSLHNCFLGSHWNCFGQICQWVPRNKSEVLWILRICTSLWQLPQWTISFTETLIPCLWHSQTTRLTFTMNSILLVLSMATVKVSNLGFHPQHFPFLITFLLKNLHSTVWRTFQISFSSPSLTTVY